MTPSAKIREAIEVAGRALSISEIAKATRLQRSNVSASCFNQARTGHLVKSGAKNYTQRFSIGADVSIPGRHSRSGPYSQNRDAIAKRQARKAAADERQKERDRLKDERAKASADNLRKADRNAKAKAKKRQVPLAAMAKSAEKRSEAKAAAPDRPAMTSEDFIAQGGKVERLQQGQSSQPFRNIRSVMQWSHVGEP